MRRYQVSKSVRTVENVRRLQDCNSVQVATLHCHHHRYHHHRNIIRILSFNHLATGLCPGFRWV